MTTGSAKMQHSPTPEEVEHVAFFIRWWQEFLGGAIIGITGLYLKSKGRDGDTVIIPISEEEIEHRMTICRQGIELNILRMLDERDRRLDEKLDYRDDKFLDKIEKLHIRLNKEAGIK